MSAHRRTSSQLKERVKRATDNYGRADRLTFLCVDGTSVMVLNDENGFADNFVLPLINVSCV